jgi:hypothetical protein
LLCDLRKEFDHIHWAKIVSSRKRRERENIKPESNKKDDGGHIFKTMNPLPSFRALATNINHFKPRVINVKLQL